MKKENSSKSRCQVCESNAIDVIFEIYKVPVHVGLLWPKREEALIAPKGDIRLGYCRNCGYVSNLDFNPELMQYTQEYDNSLHFSPRFQGYARSQAERLVEKYNLFGKDIIEIGSGKGDFLEMLCDLGDNRGIGFDPSFLPDPNEKKRSTKITFIKDYYSEQYSNYKVDLLCSRHVLEHIPRPREFLTMLRQALRNRTNTIIFLEVPDFLSTLSELRMWDIIYEHCSYFTNRSLAYLVKECDFLILDIANAFDGQFLTIDVQPQQGSRQIMPQTDDAILDDIDERVKRFFNNYHQKMSIWKHQIEDIKESGKRAVVWGAGAKGLSFLNMLKIRDEIQFAVDINPRKHGMYIAGTGQEIVPPEFLRKYKPDIVIVMNTIYKNEIQRQVEDLSVESEFIYP